MKSRLPLPDAEKLFDLDTRRTEPPNSQGIFYWDGDILLNKGQAKFNLTAALSQFGRSLRASFKQHLISFSMLGGYAPNTYATIFSALQASLNAHPTSSFHHAWITKALTSPTFRRNKIGISRFFLHWRERDSTAISQKSLNLLYDADTARGLPRNVLSDDPTKSWLTDEEYDSLLRAVWDNYDKGISGTQVTLIKLLSMQYARRPIQIAHLKIGDIRENYGADDFGPIGKVIHFPGTKDTGSEISFRDSKFEPHSLAEHLWDLCRIQQKEVKMLYEQNFSLSLRDDQLNKLPLFCSDSRIKQSMQLNENQLQLEILANLDSELFHLRKISIGQILNWSSNTPTCHLGEAKPKGPAIPKPPISSRTGQNMEVNATRMRHTRARQLARQGIPKSMLSHWLGHTSEQSIDAYYNDPAEEARKLDEAMAPALAPLAMAFTGTLIDSTKQATRASDRSSKLEFACAGELKNVGHCGKFSFCATTSVPIPCYRCKHFEPLVDAPHQEVLDALLQRQAAEEQVVKIGGTRNLLTPIDLSADIRAVKNCIARCVARRAEREINQ